LRDANIYLYINIPTISFELDVAFAQLNFWCLKIFVWRLWWQLPGGYLYNQNILTFHTPQDTFMWHKTRLQKTSKLIKCWTKISQYKCEQGTSAASVNIPTRDTNIALNKHCKQSEMNHSNHWAQLFTLTIFVADANK